MWLSLFVIFIGAGCGALLRAGFNLLTVSASSVIPLGTLLANMVGGKLRKKEKDLLRKQIQGLI